MNKLELLDRTLGIIIKAFEKDELKPGSSCGCLVGNLIAGNLGYKESYSSWIDEEGDLIKPDWYDAVIGTTAYKELAKDQIDSTGYSLNEIESIEEAFELSRHGNPTIATRIMSTLQTLLEIHGPEAGSMIEAAKEKISGMHLQKLKTQQ